MPNIAQQDYLRIPVGEITSPTDAEKKLIKQYAEQGVIMDALIIEGTEGETGETRVFAHDPVSKKILFFSIAEGAFSEIVYSD